MSRTLNNDSLAKAIYGGAILCVVLLLTVILSPTAVFAAATCTSSDVTNCASVNTIYDNYLNPFVKVLSALVGVVVAISIVVGGIQYSAAGSDPSKVAAAKKRIYNAMLALFAYLFLFAFLQWLIPGGII